MGENNEMRGQDETRGKGLVGRDGGSRGKV